MELLRLRKDGSLPICSGVLERDQEGDRERAINLPNQALETVQRIGARKDIEKTISKKKQFIT
jgi:hypothetical protein